MKKDLEYYMSLDYEIWTSEIPVDMGGGYEACIRELGEWACVGAGETKEEAIEVMNKVKESLFKDWLKDKVFIPEPKVKKTEGSK